MESEEDLEAVLVDRLAEIVAEAGGKKASVRSFKRAGLLTSDQGVVLRVGDSEFQISIVQSR